MSDLKVQFPPEERPSTSVPVWMVIIGSIIITVLIFMAVYPFKGTFLRDLIMGRHEISIERVVFQGLTLWMWQMSFINVVLKFVLLSKERRLIHKDVIPKDLDLRDIPRLMEVQKTIMDHPKLNKSVALTRMGRVLAMWINTEDTERTLAYARMENEMDIYVSDSSYRANRLYIWAMPLLGFVGTVFGVSAGIGGFAEFLRGQVTSEEIKYQVGLITEGLAVAFYCTLLGLMTAGIAAFPSLAAEKKEEEFMGELDQYMEDRITSRLPSVRKVEFPKDDIQAMRENLERLNIDISSDQLVAAIKEIKIDFPMEELLTALQSLKLQVPVEEMVEAIREGLENLLVRTNFPMESLTKAIEEGFRRLPDPDRYEVVFSRAIAGASDLVRQKYEEFAKSYEDRVGQLGLQFAGKLDGVAGSIQAGSNDMAASINKQAADLVAQFQSSMQKVNATAEQYSMRVDLSSKSLADQMERLTEIAAEIDKLLNASRTMEAALLKLGGAKEFGDTLEAIRSHLETNDAFVQRMTKPRKIVLQEHIEEHAG